MEHPSKRCGTCRAWQSAGLQGNGECRQNPPVISGWPKTRESDWCRQWAEDDRPPPVSTETERSWQIGICYPFVRDYPDKAATWLAAVMANPDAVPAELRPVLADLFGGVRTQALPDMAANAPCCEEIFLWAEKLPGFCNDDTPEGEDDYVGVLMSMTDAEYEDSLAAIAEIPDEHPWRTIAAGSPQ